MALELWCAVVNDGSVFSVQIDAGARVHELQRKITAEQQVCGGVASKLRLHVAKRLGAWLKDDDRDVEQLMSSGRCPKAISALMRRETLMAPTRTVQEAISKAELPAPAAMAIHVLVQLPEQPSASPSPPPPAPLHQQADMITTNNNKLLQQVLREVVALRKELRDRTTEEHAVEHKKRECLAFADILAGKHEPLTKKLRLTVKALKVVEPRASPPPAVAAGAAATLTAIASSPSASTAASTAAAPVGSSSSSSSSTGARIPTFRWVKSLSKAKHADAYRAYVESHLKETLQTCDLALVGVEANKTLLSVDDERLPFGLKGGVDMLVLTNFGDDTEDMALLFPGLRMAIQVERDVAYNFEARFSQAVAKLIAVDLKTTGGQSAMLLLSDLQYSWVFLWLDSEQCIRSVTLSEPTNAFALMTSVIAKWDQSNGRFFVPFCAGKDGNRRPYKRQKISQMRPSVSNDDGDDE